MLDLRRSIVLIDNLEEAGLENQLSERIKQVVNNQWNNSHKFKKKGLQNFYILANFVHHINEDSDPSFFVAIIPKTAAIENIIFQVEWFGQGVGAHTQIRFQLDQAIVAIPQWDDEYTPQIISHNGRADLVYSLQAARVEGGEEDWSPTLGLMGEYANALQFFSVQSKAKKQIYANVVNQYRINGLSSDQKRSIFLQALNSSHELQETTIYNTVFNSCITHSLLSLRGSFAESSKTHTGLSQINPVWFNPYSIVDRLESAGVSLTALETMNTEFKKLGYDRHGSIFTEALRQQTNSYKLLAPLQDSLLKDERLESFVRKMALFIVDEEITASQFNDFLKVVKEHYGQSDLLKKMDNKMKVLFAEIENFWNEEFQGRSIEDFFKAFYAMETQDGSHVEPL